MINKNVKLSLVLLMLLRSCSTYCILHCRMIGLGSSSMMSRLSSMVAPQVVLLGDYLTPAPFLIFGVVSLIAGALALFLPETLGQPLPQTIEDAINLGRFVLLRSMLSSSHIEVSPSLLNVPGSRPPRDHSEKVTSDMA